MDGKEKPGPKSYQRRKDMCNRAIGWCRRGMEDKVGQAVNLPLEIKRIRCSSRRRKWPSEEEKGRACKVEMR